MSDLAPGPIKNFVAGGAGGMALVLVGHPLDTIKVRLQTSSDYRGTWHCATTTVQKEGVKALYRGMATPLVGVTPMYALCFLGYGVGQSIFWSEHTLRDLDVVKIGLAGATSGIFTTPILAPGERAKVILQTQTGTNGFKGPVEVWKHLYREGGIASVNRGFCATLARDSLASMFYFSTYECLKRTLTPEGAQGPSVAGTLFAGGMAGILNWLPALPIDTLKSKLQVAPEGKYKHGIRSVFREVMRTEGFLSLYKGFSAVMLRAFPANAACFLGFETAIKGLNMIKALDGY